MAWASHNSYLGNKEEEEGKGWGGWIKKKKTEKRRARWWKGLERRGQLVLCAAMAFVCKLKLVMGTETTFTFLNLYKADN